MAPQLAPKVEPEITVTITPDIISAPIGVDPPLPPDEDQGEREIPSPDPEKDEPKTDDN